MNVKKNYGNINQTNRDARYELYFKCIRTPIVAIDSDFNVVFMNYTGRKIVGETKETLKGKKCYDVFKTDDYHTEKCACVKCMKTEKTETSTTVAKFKGNTLPIQYAGAPLYNDK